MNRQTRTTLSILAASLMLAASASASADDGLSRVATGVGRAIATQGNAALMSIREEIRETLRETLAPLLPADAHADSDQATAQPSV
jgi:hypothetical protein